MNDHQAILVDWGTSNLRLWVMDAKGVLQHQHSCGMGASRLAPDEFYPVFIKILADLGLHPSPQAPLPVFICGMAGARHGWAEVPYLPIPVDCQTLPDHARCLQKPELQVHIMPGLAAISASKPDVMRGEETQLLGFYQQNPTFSGLFCLPGTHSKWGVIRHGVIDSFQTAMTGEVFSLLSSASVLKQVINGETHFAADHPAFLQGVETSYHQPADWLFNLFKVRAGGLLLDHLGADAAAQLSGLLIGAELSAALRHYGADQEIALIVSGGLAALYQQAFAAIGRDYHFFDADSLVQAGLAYARQKRSPMP